MIRKTGGSTGAGISAMPGPAEAVRLAARPWAVTGSMPVDLLVIWALIEQRAGNAAAGLYEMEAVASGLEWQVRTSTAQIADMEMLGRRIDISKGSSNAVHPAADAVAAAVAAHPRGHRIEQAARGGAPGGWAAPARWLMPERWVVDGDEAMWCYVERTAGRHCPLVRVTSAEAIAANRAEYVGWWDDLAGLAWVLGCRALGFAVTGPSVVREPWVA